MLYELLTLDQYKDKTKRLLPTITVERVSGGYKALLHDHASSQYLVVEFDTLAGLAEALESSLANDLEGWRSFKPWKGRQPPKPKSEENT